MKLRSHTQAGKLFMALLERVRVLHRRGVESLYRSRDGLVRREIRGVNADERDVLETTFAHKPDLPDERSRIVQIDGRGVGDLRISWSQRR